MLNKKMTINLFDLAAIVIVFLLFLLIFLPKKQEDFSRIKLRVKSYQTDIYETAKDDKEVYFDTIDEPVAVAAVSKKTEAGGREYLEVELVGSGKIKGDKYIFEGQRVLIGQKAEIHDAYFLQGFIVEVKDENNS